MVRPGAIVFIDMVIFVMPSVVRIGTRTRTRTGARRVVVRIVVGIDVVLHVVVAVFHVLVLVAVVVMQEMVAIVGVGIGLLGLRLGSKEPSLHARSAVGAHEGNFPHADFLPIDRGHSGRAATA